MNIQSPVKLRTVCLTFSGIFRRIRGSWCIFSHTHRSATRASLPLSENQKKCPDFWKKDSDFVLLWVKFSIQTLILTPKYFPARPLFSGTFDEIYIEVPYFHKHPHPLSWKISGCAPALRYYSFCKTLHLKCLTVFWMRVCLDNCSVICKVTWCYVLHETHSEFCQSSAML